MVNPTQVFALFTDKGDTSFRYFDKEQVKATSSAWMNDVLFYSIWGIDTRSIIVLAGSNGQVKYFHDGLTEDFQSLPTVQQHPQPQDLFGLWGIEEDFLNTLILGLAPGA